MRIFRVRILASDNLDNEDASGEHIDLIGICWCFYQCLRRHVGKCTRTFSELVSTHAWVEVHHLGHAKVGQLGPGTSSEKNVVTGKVAVLNTIAVKVIEGQSDVMGDIHLDMIGERSLPALQEVSEALLHQFHEENWSVIATTLRVFQDSQELYDTRMLQVTQDSALLLEATNEISDVGIIGGEEGVVEDFGSTRKTVELSFDDTSI